jgi:hypothetical protein
VADRCFVIAAADVLHRQGIAQFGIIGLFEQHFLDQLFAGFPGHGEHLRFGDKISPTARYSLFVCASIATSANLLPVVLFGGLLALVVPGVIRPPISVKLANLANAPLEVVSCLTT